MRNRSEEHILKMRSTSAYNLQVLSNTYLLVATDFRFYVCVLNNLHNFGNNFEIALNKGQ